MRNRISVAVTGYYGTGSSALIDLLKEYDNVKIAAPIDEEYEHMALYSQGAFFDLASILLSPFRAPYVSDMAINQFIDAAYRLNDNNFGWYGSYKYYYGDKYMNSVEEFVSEISKKKERKSASHAIKVRKTLKKAFFQIMAKIIYKRPITSLGREYIFDNKAGYFAMPTREEFSIAAKKYINSYIEMCSKDSEINVFDHLIWPQQSVCIEEFMPEILKVIVLQRDPRDVYLLNKYYWHSIPISNSKPYYPTSPKEFIEEWKRSVSLNLETSRVLVLNFEDLIYNYNSTLEKIEKFLGINKLNHLKKYHFFEPSKSIENTQIYNISKEWNTEIKEIERELSNYLYDFPFKRIPNKKLWFDTNLQLVNIKRGIK